MVSISAFAAPRGRGGWGQNPMESGLLARPILKGLFHEMDIFFRRIINLNQYFCMCTEGFKHFLIALYRDIEV